MARRTVTVLFLLLVVFPRGASSQQAIGVPAAAGSGGGASVVDPRVTGPYISVNPPSLTIRQPMEFRRVPAAWIDPLPGTSGVDDLELHSLGLVVPDSIQRYWQAHTPELHSTTSVLPNSIDWSLYDSPVKAQGRCGSCWAFAVVAAVENVGLHVDLSEQVLISCSKAGSCSGGYYEAALRFLQANGLPEESSYPYTQTKGSCAARSPSPEFMVRVSSATMTMWGDRVQPNDLKAALISGPVIVRMAVYSDFDVYRGGIYKHSNGYFRGFHAVSVVGYNDEQRCFKAKNSWGSRWGEGGYVRVSYDDLSSVVSFGGYGAQVAAVYTEYREAAVSITNQGTEDLVVKSIQPERPWIILKQPVGLLRVAPGATRAVELGVDWDLVPVVGGMGNVRILSNDKDRGSVAVQVRARRGGRDLWSSVAGDGESGADLLAGDKEGAAQEAVAVGADGQAARDPGQAPAFRLEQNYPNPFNPTTVVSSQYSVASWVKIAVYDLLGREVAVPVNEWRAAGRYRDELDASGWPSGVYVYRLNSGSVILSKRMLLVR